MRRLALVLAALASCKAVPPPPPGWVETPTQAPPYDAGDADGLGTDLGETCVALRRNGCQEGAALSVGLTCYEHLNAMVGMGFSIPAACIRDAGSADEIRHCSQPGQHWFRCKP